MNVYIGGEVHLFLHAFWQGILFRSLYDLFLIGRSPSKNSRWTGISDLLYWIIGAIWIFALLYQENMGIPRLYIFVGMLGGMGCYHWGPSRIIVLFGRRMIEKLRKNGGKTQKKVENHKKRGEKA